MDRLKEIDMQIKELFEMRREIIAARKRAASAHPDLFLLARQYPPAATSSAPCMSMAPERRRVCPRSSKSPSLLLRSNNSKTNSIGHKVFKFLKSFNKMKLSAVSPHQGNEHEKCK